MNKPSLRNIVQAAHRARASVRSDGDALAALVLPVAYGSIETVDRALDSISNEREGHLALRIALASREGAQALAHDLARAIRVHERPQHATQWNWRWALALPAMALALGLVLLKPAGLPSMNAIQDVAKPDVIGVMASSFEAMDEAASTPAAEKSDQLFVGDFDS